jgi:hypothetical protein
VKALISKCLIMMEQYRFIFYGFYTCIIPILVGSYVFLFFEAILTEAQIGLE